MTIDEWVAADRAYCCLFSRYPSPARHEVSGHGFIPLLPIFPQLWIVMRSFSFYQDMPLDRKLREIQEI